MRLFMLIKSFLIQTKPNSAKSLSQDLGELPGIELYPADKHDLIILVLESEDASSEQELMAKINSFSTVMNMSLVSAFS